MPRMQSVKPPSPASMVTSGSTLKKRSIVLAGHATSLALEPAFWAALERWANEDGRATTELVADIDAARTHGSLASAIRVALFERVQAQASGAPAEDDGAAANMKDLSDANPD